MWLADWRRLLAAALGVTGLVLAPVAASAQTDEQRAQARSLATEGASAFDGGRYQDAVDMFGKAESLVHAPPHLLFLARSHVKLGQYVRAREAYLKVVKETLPSNAPKAFRDAQSQAAAEVRAIEPKIASLTLKVEGGSGATDTAVTVDGAVLPSMLVGVPQPIDPGTHVVEAGATGLRAPQQQFTLGEGEKKAVVLKLESRPGAAPLVAPAATPATPAAATPAAPSTEPGQPATQPAAGAPPAAEKPAGSSKSGLRIGSYVAFGVGALGLIGGTVFTLQSASKRSDADEKFAQCGGDAGCTNENPLSGQVDQLDQDAGSAQTLGIVGFALGGVGVAAGVTLLMLSSGGDSQQASVEPWLGLGTAGVRGRF
jgi:hypothetical protein